MRKLIDRMEEGGGRVGKKKGINLNGEDWYELSWNSLRRFFFVWVLSRINTRWLSCIFIFNLDFDNFDNFVIYAENYSDILFIGYIYMVF